MKLYSSLALFGFNSRQFSQNSEITANNVQGLLLLPNIHTVS